MNIQPLHASPELGSENPAQKKFGRLAQNRAELANAVEYDAEGIESIISPENSSRKTWNSFKKRHAFFFNAEPVHNLKDLKAGLRSIHHLFTNINEPFHSRRSIGKAFLKTFLGPLNILLALAFACGFILVPVFSPIVIPVIHFLHLFNIRHKGSDNTIREDFGEAGELTVSNFFHFVDNMSLGLTQLILSPVILIAQTVRALITINKGKFNIEDSRSIKRLVDECTTAIEKGDKPGVYITTILLHQKFRGFIEKKQPTGIDKETEAKKFGELTGYLLKEESCTHNTLPQDKEPDLHWSSRTPMQGDSKRALVSFLSLFKKTPSLSPDPEISPLSPPAGAV